MSNLGVFELLVFTVDPERAEEVLSAGAAAIVVDWENQDKYERQAGADTEINEHGVEELAGIRSGCRGHVICRINGMHAGTGEEVEKAIGEGADEILLPMVRRRAEVEEFIALVRGRVASSTLLETREGLALAGELGDLGLRRVYVGLNDLAIDTGTRNLFAPVVDGRLEECRRKTVAPFGFGGLTIPGYGAPVGSRLLAGEMGRLGCAFSFLRRSFWRDSAGKELGACVAAIQGMMREVWGRSAAEVEADRRAFQEAVAAARWER